MHIEDDQHGKEYLTDELRRHFEYVGESLVEFDVRMHNYSRPEKHYAALYWLRERRKEKGDQSDRRHKQVMWVAGLTLLAAVAGLWLAVYFAP